MIWVMGLLLALAVSFYLATPFLAREINTAEAVEVEAYKAELRALENSSDTDEAKKAIIQARLIKAARSELPIARAQSALFAGLIGVTLIGASATIYAFVGYPDFEPESRQAPPPMVAEAEGSDFRDLLPRFEARLAENPEDATGWYLYGRTLMLAGQSDAGLRAYERALELTDTPEIRKEYEAAKTFAEQLRSGPRVEDIAAMQNLSEEDRQTAIETMVEGLRTRLEKDPSNAEGWVRLLRSRKVLAQTEQAEADIQALRKALPEQADEIIKQSGWNDE